MERKLERAEPLHLTSISNVSAEQGVRQSEAAQFKQITGGAGSRQFSGDLGVTRLANQITLAQQGRHRRLTLLGGDHRVGRMTTSVSKIQLGQLWKKDGTDEIYLVTRVYSEALTTMATLRKSGSETEALVRVKVERRAEGQTLAGFSPAQEDERF